MATTLEIIFSQNGEYFAYSSPDGSLKIWETSTGVLKQEYTHSSHLSATCSCLAWSPRTKNDTPKKKKKRKSLVADELGNLELVAMGTTSGGLLLYSLTKGDLHTQLTDGHNQTVNDMSWSLQGDTLFSCSDDQHVVQWDVAKAKVKRKWKADTQPVHAVAVCTSDQFLLTASRQIKLWDVQKAQVLKTFTGHATEVTRLLSVGHVAGRMENGAEDQELSPVNGAYFLSAARNDRLINAWHINLSTSDKTALGTFALPEEPVYMQLSQPRAEGQPMLLLAVTRSGQLLVFQHTLNGPCKQPLSPKYTVQISTSGGQKETPRPIPVLAGMVRNDTKLLLAHGSLLKPTFENMAVKSLEGDTCLIRDDASKTSMQVQQVVSKVKTPTESGDVTVLGPGHMAPSGPGGKKKRKKSGELSMDERLHAISIDRPSGSSKDRSQPPKADTLATLLAQGLQSQDKTILNNVFQNTNEMVLRNTVKRLPVPVIVPLVLELSKRMHGHAQSGHNLIKWVRVVLTVHTSYLMTFPELVETLSSLYQMMDSRTSMFSRLSRLQGKLDLMLSQVTSQGQEEEETAASQQPLLLYQDESSDEDLEDMVLGAIATTTGSDSEDNWEELSGMEDEDEDEGDDSPPIPRKRSRDSEQEAVGGASNGVEDEEESMSDSDGD